MDKFIKISMRNGHFDLCDPRKNEWLMTLECHYGKVQLVLSEEPHWSKWHGVEDAVEIIRDGYKRTWSSSREKDLETLGKIADDLDGLELLWHRKLLISAQKAQADAYKQVASIMDTVDMLSASAAKIKTQ